MFNNKTCRQGISFNAVVKLGGGAGGVYAQGAGWGGGGGGQKLNNIKF